MTSRELTVYHLAKHSPFLPGEITRLLRLAASHRRLCEMHCNNEGTEPLVKPYRDGPRWVRYCWGARDEAKRDRIEKRICDICDLDPKWEGSDVPLSKRVRQDRPRPIFQYDPRGATVKLAVPDGFTDDWGREGICL